MRAISLAFLLALPLLSQTPAERISSGFKTLRTGSWTDAFREWEQQALPFAPVDPEPRKVLEEWVPKTWSLGTWELLQTSPLSTTWQRQWWLASFDQGVVFFTFDCVKHKGEWRVFRLQVSRDPAAVLPGLDLYSGLAARNRE